MESHPAAPLSGRRAEAARNDRRIIEAARAVFIADPGAPIALVAARAGVGIGALYRRYSSKDALLQRLCLDGLQLYIAAAEAALVDDGDPWPAFVQFLRTCLDAGSGALTVRFAGTFSADEELHRAGRAAHDLTRRLLERTRAAGALRADLEVGDLSLLFEQLQAIRVGNEQRTAQLRHRHLTLLLDALHAPSPSPLPGPPPSWDEISSRYTT
ncbi:MAG: TetR/AcrR family transcriptional regulator [Chloroflexi bacterium]|nr:TetR/AcrR family transcriptional regulator [Chloroflexota bacterium]